MPMKFLDKIAVKPLTGVTKHTTEKHGMGHLFPKKTQKLAKPKMPKLFKGMDKLIPKF